MTPTLSIVNLPSSCLLRSTCRASLSVVDTASVTTSSPATVLRGIKMQAERSLARGSTRQPSPRRSFCPGGFQRLRSICKSIKQALAKATRNAALGARVRWLPKSTAKRSTGSTAALAMHPSSSATQLVSPAYENFQNIHFRVVTSFAAAVLLRTETRYPRRQLSSRTVRCISKPPCGTPLGSSA